MPGLTPAQPPWQAYYPESSLKAQGVPEGLVPSPNMVPQSPLRQDPFGQPPSSGPDEIDFMTPEELLAWRKAAVTRGDVDDDLWKRSGLIMHGEHWDDSDSPGYYGDPFADVPRERPEVRGAMEQDGHRRYFQALARWRAIQSLSDEEQVKRAQEDPFTDFDRAPASRPGLHKLYDFK